MTKEKVNHKALVITSFKGGAGKTTLSILATVSALLYKYKKSTNAYDEIHFFDMDLDGSGAYYTLYGGNEVSKKYINDYTCVEELINYMNIIKIAGENEDKFYSYVLDPSVRIKKNIYGDSLAKRLDVSILDDIFLDKIVDLITHLCNDINTKDEKKRKLFIFDCSPGYNNFTQSLSNSLSKIDILTVTEVFASTYDHAHVSKSIDNLKYLTTSNKNEEVGRKLILVDNFQIENKEDIINSIKSKLNNIDIIEFSYNEYIFKFNLFNNRKTLGEKECVNAYDDFELYERIFE
jgi:cellulose biosynthesis protein BcsQ